MTVPKHHINHFKGQRQKENVLPSRTSITSCDCLFFKRRQNIICRIITGILLRFSFIYVRLFGGGINLLGKKTPSSCDKTIMLIADLKDGTLEVYFRLAEQFRTQDEPAFCGLSTLTMVLNSLAVDPKKVWKGVWRW
jgi:hypothetical protein